MWLKQRPSDTVFGVGLAIGIAVLAYIGWRTFYFLTDDAFIAFRYVSNARAGWGLVWNPPPFVPVEGYTSFLWVILLKWTWGLTGIEPPIASNWLSFGFGLASLGLAYAFVRRMQLPLSVAAHRTLAALVLLGAVTNRTFLAWLSSGLETSLFNFLLLWWLFEALAPAATHSRRWGMRLSTAAALLTLTRPDGLLFCAATICVLLSTGMSRRDRAVSLAPLLTVALHLLWRHSFYGAWLPNTYYAKVVDPWPSAGLRYLASFTLENGTWLWACLLIACAVRGWRRAKPGAKKALPQLRAWLVPLFAIGAVLAHIGFYTLIVGGDHFEYRVYSHLVLLCLISSVKALSVLAPRPRDAILGLSCLLLVSYPIAWVHWSETRHISTRDETFQLARPIAHKFPRPLNHVVSVWDGWQQWLTQRFVGMRHQEHKVFWLAQTHSYPRRNTPEYDWKHRHILAAASVGIVGWRLPGVAIIDEHGLNDRVVARTTAVDAEGKRMAHERTPPPGYLECLGVDMAVTWQSKRPSGVKRLRRDRPPTDDEIRECEATFWARARD